MPTKTKASKKKPTPAAPALEELRADVAGALAAVAQRRASEEKVEAAMQAFRELAAAEPAQLGDQLLIPGVEPEPEPVRPRGRYEWARHSACPRCKSMNTKRTTSHGDTQYRQCQVPICRKSYAQIGKLVTEPVPPK